MGGNKLKKIIWICTIPVFVIILSLIMYQLYWKAESDRRFKIMDKQDTYNGITIEE